jgi:chaperone required for assembly of F1-ATPase
MTSPPPKPKAAFTTVSVASAQGGFAIRLDDRPLRSPAGREIVAPTQKLAEAIAGELRATSGQIRADAVPLTRMAGTAVDRIAMHRTEIERQLVEYAETEHLCHRADHPPDLVARQQASWQPLLDWLALRHDALLVPTTGIVSKPQSEPSLAALRAAIHAFDDWRLAALSVAVAASGSLVIGLALADRRLDAAQAFAAAELDSTFQIETWGEDAEATARRAEVREELDLAARLFDLLAA